MTAKRFLLLFLLLISLKGGTQSQLRYQFTHLSTEQGLSSSFVRKIIQDPFGFIWAGTQDGLNRYDGKKFRWYNKDNGNYSLAGSDIRDLVIDSTRSTLWVITSYGGVDGINYQTGKIWFHYEQQKDPEWKQTLFNSVIVSDSSLFIGSSQGLLELDINRRKIKNAGIRGLTSSMNIDKLVAGPAKQLWAFINNEGIITADHQRKKIIAKWVYSNKNNPAFTTYDATIPEKEQVFIATNTGLKKVDFKNDRIIVTNKPFPAINYPSAAETYACFQEKNGTLLISNAQLLIRLDTFRQDYVVLSENSSADPDSWLKSVYSIFCDKDQNLWLGCQPGLAFAPDNPSPFYRIYQSSNSTTKVEHAYYIFPENDSIIFSCAQNGLYKININKGTITALAEGVPFYHAMKGPTGELIVSSRLGTYILSGQKLIPIQTVYPEFKPFGTLVFNSHIISGDSVLLIGTENALGLIKWNLKTKKLSSISESSDGIKIPENEINTIYKDNRGAIWVPGNRTLSVLTPDLKTVKQVIPYNKEQKKYYSIFFDVKQVGQYYYLASYGNGIVILDSDYQFLKELTSPKLLPANSTYKILPYRDSIIVITTNNGLALVDPTGKQSPSFYFKTDGLHSNTFEENSGNSFGGKIYAGGEKGITVITPDFLRTDSAAPVLYIDEIRMASTGSVSTITDLGLKKLEVPNNILQTTISFSALNYRQPEKTTYAYRIAELHKDWIDLGSNNFIQLMGLPPGEYIIFVKASNGFGFETAAPLIIRLAFLPKWYQTWWFKLAVVLLILSLVFLFYYYRLSQIKKRELIRKNIASDLHDDIGSALNSIKIFTHLARTEPDKENYLAQIEDSLSQTSIGLRDIIWVLNDKYDSPAELMERIKKFALPLCAAKGIDFSYKLNLEEKSQKLLKDEKRNLLLITKEAINNSIRHSECTAISVCLTGNGSYKKLEITDNGKGFDPNQTHRGNGIENILFRAEQLNYEVSINTSKSGTVIILSTG